MIYIYIRGQAPEVQKGQLIQHKKPLLTVNKHSSSQGPSRKKIQPKGSGRNKA